MRKLLLAVCLLSIHVIVLRAQTGPGGVGNTLGDGQPRNLLWLEANSLPLTNGADILTWPDRSGNNNNLTTTAAISPIFRNAAPINGFGYAEFSKANNRIVINPFNDMPQSGLTTIVVYRSTDSNDGILSYAIPGQSDVYTLRNSNALRTFLIDGTSTTSTVVANAASAQPKILINSWENVNGVLTWQLNGAESGAAATVFSQFPGIKVGQTITSGGSLSLGNVQNGVNTGYSAADAFQGDITEIIVYDKKLNDAQLRILSNYLSVKYNVTIANDMYAGNVPYHNEMVGIGQLSNQTHTLANSAGVLVASYNATLGNNEFIMLAHNNAAKTATTSDVDGAAIKQRWNRIWYLDGGQNFDASITFDLGEGVNGQIPENKDNYVLLRRSGTSGNFTAIAIASADKTISGDRISFRATAAQLTDGYYTLGTLDDVNSPVTGVNVRTWYSYQSGNWNSPTTWTLDAGIIPLFLNPGNDIPAPSDRVIVTNGRTVTANVNNVAVAGMEVYGTLNLGTTAGHNFTTLAGNGRIRLQGNNPGTGPVDNFPAGDASGFADAATGGTVEIFGSATPITLNQPRTFNHLIINLSGSATAVLKADYTINGDLRINQGILQVNDNVSTARNVDVMGDLVIESAGQIIVGTGGRHQFNFYGNVNNNGGTLSFTNRAAVNATTDDSNGLVDANFLSGFRDQDVICNGPCKFYRMKIDKGSDDSYKLNISASSAANFSLFGYASQNHGATDQLTTNTNAFALLRGTVVINNNVTIPNITVSGNYNVSEGATLWVNGGTVSCGGGALVLYGRIRVSSGVLNALITSGITFRKSGTLEVEGGTVNVHQIRTSVLGVTNVGGYIQTGGVVNVGLGGGSNDYYTFSLTYPGNVFRMSGGTLNLTRPTSKGFFFVNSDPENQSVTGGTIVFDISENTSNYTITSRVPFWNLVLRKSAGSGTTFLVTGGTSGSGAESSTITAQPLIVQNSLSIENTVTLNAAGNNVELWKDFSINTAATYTPGANTTYFNGFANGVLDFGTTQRNFNNVEVNKSVAANGVTLATGNTTKAIQINGSLSVVQGTLNYGNFVVNAKTSVYNAGTIGSAAGTGKLLLDGGAAQTISSTDGLFYSVDLDNNNGVSLALGAMRVAKTLTLVNGVFNINTRKLTLEGAAATIAGTGFGTTKMIQTAGNASDGGLEHYFTINKTLVYPLGTNAFGTIRYTPATVLLQNIVDDGYVQIIPSDQILQTTNLGGGADILSYYWRVTHRDFSTLPRVSYQFAYAQSDVGGIEANYVPGKVLDVAPFTRATDGPVNDVNTTTNIITFNGTGASGSVFLLAGFPLEQANYTAGGPLRFSGAPTVYYNRENGHTGWADNNKWSTVGYNGTATTAQPGPGDIVRLRNQNGSSDQDSWVRMDVNTSVASIIFDNTGGGYPPRVTIPANQTVSLGVVDGEGEVYVEFTATQQPTFNSSDFGGFAKQPNSFFIYRPNSDNFNAIPLPTNITEYPNLRIEGGNGNISQRIVTNTVPITINRDMWIDWAGTFRSGANVTIARDLLPGNGGGNGGRFELGDNVAHTVSVGRDIAMNNHTDCSITARNVFTTGLTHRLTVGRNITQNVGIIDLYNGTGFNNNAVLELKGTDIGTYTTTTANVPDLFRIEMNKGTSIATTFTLVNAVTLSGTTNTATKALELKNGLLILNHPAINFVLSSAGDFTIPSTSGLTVTQGQVSVSGANTGISLDGLLRINGGTVTLDDAVNGGNNYIEYGATGNARIDLTAGSLTVGSQIRRGLTSTAGILRYTQTGGTLVVGKNAAPETSRGVFEVTNPGSLFSHTGGSFTIVRGLNSTFVPSLLLEPASTAPGITGTVTVGNANTPAGAASQNIGIKASVAINNLTIVNSSGANPTVKIYSLPLSLNGSLTVAAGATVNAQGFDLIIRMNFMNDGAYIASGNKLIMQTTSSRILSGSGTFDIYDFHKTNNGTLDIGRSIIVNNEFRLLNGTLRTATNYVDINGNAIIDAIHTSTGGFGLIFSGNSTQTLSRTSGVGFSTLGIVTISNPNNVVIPDGQDYAFRLTGTLRMDQGVFDIGGNLLELTTSGTILPVNPYSKSNMIRTNNSFTNSGLKKNFTAGYKQDFIYPVGQLEYTPITITLGAPGNTFGSSAGSITVRTANETHPSVVEDIELSGPQIVDENNALRYYWILDGNTIANDFRATAIFNYAESDVRVTAPYTEADYIAARILADNNPLESINKYSTLEVDENANTITIGFSGVTDEGISGDYFAGVDQAIPSIVPIYRTVRNGLVTEGFNLGVYDNLVPGGGAPDGAVLIIRPGHTLNFNVNDVSLYKTEIQAGAVLNVAGTYAHRLGIVTGEGTLRITSNTNSAVVPAGFYQDFFGCSGGKLEFAGTGSYDILGGITAIRNLTLSGAGDRLLANNDLTVCEDFLVAGPYFQNNNNRGITIDDDLLITSGTFDKGNGNRTLFVGDDLQMDGGTFTSVSAGDRIVEGNVIINAGTFHTGSGGRLAVSRDINYVGGTFTGGSGTVRIILQGSTNQQLNGTFTGVAQLHRLEINNAAGATLGGNVDMTTELLLTTGNIFTGTNRFKLSNTATITPPQGRPTSFVNGKLHKVMDIGSTFVFPVGKGNRWRYTTISNVSIGSMTWASEFFGGNPVGQEPTVLNLISSDPSVVRVSQGEYWKISDGFTTSTGANARIGLSWGFDSDVSPNASEREALKVMIWNVATSRWDNKGGTNFSSGHTQAQGDFWSVANSGFSEHVFTLGSSDPANPLPVELLTFTGMNVEQANYLDWETATERNNAYFELQRSPDGESFTSIATIVARGNGSVGGKYSYVDGNPLNGRNYYRLKQVDIDGKVSYPNKLVMLTVEKENTFQFDFSVYPNPTDYHDVNLRIEKSNNEPVEIRMYDVKGYKLLERTVEGGAWTELTLDTLPTNLTAGVYLIEMRQGAASRVKRVMIR